VRQDRLVRIGAAAHEVGAPDGLLERGDRSCLGLRRGERLGVARVARRDAKSSSSNNLGNASRCDRPCTPAPRTASELAPSRASARAATAAVAPVRTAVITVPSITHSGAPLSSSNSAIKRLMRGKPAVVVAGEDRDELGLERPRQVPGHRTEEAPSVLARPVRGGTEAFPALSSRSATSSASEQRREIDQVPDVFGVEEEQRRHPPMIGGRRAGHDGPPATLRSRRRPRSA
jgi:hypothetical protein